MPLINEKIEQAVGILRETGLDCWLTFVRETGMNGDPVMPFLAPGHVTWQSAFIVTAGGDARAVVGQYDRKTIEDTGAYTRVESYVQSIRQPLIDALRKLAPRIDRDQLLGRQRGVRRPDARHVPQAAVDPWRDGFRGSPRLGRAGDLGAPRPQDADRTGADSGGHSPHRGDLRRGRALSLAGPHRARRRRLRDRDSSRRPASPAPGRRPPARRSSPGRTPRARTTPRPGAVSSRATSSTWTSA